MDRSSFLAWLLTLSPSTAEVSLIPTCHVYVLYFSDFTFSVCGSFSVFDFLLPSDKCDKLASNRIMLHCTFDEMFIRICCRLNTERESCSLHEHIVSLFSGSSSRPPPLMHTLSICVQMAMPRQSSPSSLYRSCTILKSYQSTLNTYTHQHTHTESDMSISCFLFFSFRSTFPFNLVTLFKA